MALDPQPVDPSESAAFNSAVALAFGELADDEDIAAIPGFFDPDFALAVRDGGRMVATASTIVMDMTLPAGDGHACPVLAVPGVTAVGVLPTHRRQGLLTRLMARQLSDYRERGYPLAILTASEGGIYQRFGYGPAQLEQSVAIDNRRAAFHGPAPGAGRLRMVDPDEAGKVLPGIHGGARRTRPGELSRSALWWDRHLADPEQHRGGGAGRLYAVHESGGGDADGWVSYRYHQDWNNGLPRHRAEVHDLVAADPEVMAALWRFVLDLDLVGEVTAGRRPMDEPLRWLLRDPRQMRTTCVGDHLWVRVIDVVGALCARGYRVEGTVVLEVTGEGRFVLETGLGSGSCRAATKVEKADLQLGVLELGAIYLGGVRPSELAAAGRITELRPGALTWLDQAFGGQVAPFCSIGF